jgi:phage-related protein
MGELQEQIGAKLLPVMSKLATIGLTVVDWISKNTTVVGILIGVIASLLAITYAVGVAVKLYTTYTKLAAAAQWLLNAAMTANPIGLVVLAIVALTAAFVVAYKKSETFRRIVDAAFGAVKRVVVGAVSTVVGFVRSHWRLLLAILTGPIGLAVYAIAHNWQRIRDGAAAAWSRIKSVVSAAAGAIPRLISSAWSGLAGIARAAFDRARDAALSAFYRIRDGVSRIVGNVVDAVRRLPDRIVSAVGDLGRLLYNAGVDIIQGLLDGIGDKIGDLRDKLGDITDMIPDIKGPPARDRELLRENGRLIMDGLMSGFDDRQSRIRDKLRRLTGEIRSSITATTAQPITLDAPSLSAGSLANARGNVAYITVNGAVDPVSTARQIRELLEREATWTGRTVGVVA